ncbi:ubiquitinyl hydrolase 1 [Sarracenia purpurea var. burkii]
MDSHLTEPIEFDSSPLDSVDLTQTPPAFSLNSPTKTLDDILHSSVIPSEINVEDSSNYNYFLPYLGETIDDQPDLALFLDAGSHEGHEDDKASRCPQVNTNPKDPSSHQSPTSCESCRGTSNSALGYPGETGIKPLVSGSSAWVREIRLAIVGVGIANPGNTCFLYAILQCFAHIVPLVHGLWSYNHPTPCDGEKVPRWKQVSLPTINISVSVPPDQ